MAKGFDQKSRNFRESVLSGSEELLYCFCGPCNKDGCYIEAEGYCINCQEYLCGTCFQYHRLRVPTSKHVTILDGMIPRKKTSSRESVCKDTCTDKCLIHADEVMNYFCKSHEQLGCMYCKMKDHKHCEDTSYIPDISQSIVDNGEYKEWNNRLSNLKKVFHDNLRKAKKNVAEIEKIHSEAIGDIRKFRSEINNFFDKLENEIKVKANQQKAEDIQLMNSVSVSSESMIKEIDTLATKLETLKTSKKINQMFVAMKKSKNQVETIECSLEKMEKENNVRKFRFEPATLLLDLISSLRAFGELTAMNNHMNYPLSEKNKSYVTEMPAKSARDDNTCSFTELAILRRIQPIFTDCQDEKPKLPDRKKGKITPGLKLSSNHSTQSK